jgi:putative serine protease PepD
MTNIYEPYQQFPVPDVPVPEPARELPRRRRGRLVVAGVAAVALAAGSGLTGAAAVAVLDHRTTTTTASAATSVSPVANTTSSSIASVVSAVDKDVVSLTVQGARETDLGSGVVIRSDGLILTNNHVIAAAAQGGQITVTFTDGKTASATVVAADAGEDLAIVQAAGVSGLPTATFANSDSVQVGDTVIAIGNELGLSNSVSAGIVSALHRTVHVASDDSGSGSGPFGSSRAATTTTYKDAIQTDASINEGDSGGALFNMAGQVIGIDSAIATASDTSSGSVGIGFAIASNDVVAFVNVSLT